MKSVALFSAEPAKGWLPWGTLAPFVCVALVAAPVIATSLPLEHFGFVDHNGDPIGVTGLFPFLLSTFTGIAITVTAWIILIERRPLRTVGLVGPGAARKFLIGLLIGTGLIVAIVTSIWFAGGYTVGPLVPSFATARVPTIIGLLLVCFAWQSSVEEFVFRGWLLSVVARKFNLPLAITLSSLTFTFLHYWPELTAVALLNILLFAVFLACWAVQAGSIWGVMGWHAGWNWLCGTGFELPVTGIDAKLPALLVKLTPVGPRDLTGGAQGPEASIFCTIVLGLAIVFVLSRRPTT